ncbi:MAG: PadR family transcriptional regulator [Dethiobacter sp.]|jgi:DNA-binding PadR family transcriptional regulator|nr:MAG: PadR family transcriptional regulator [Dethiobacter sp.]
MKQRVLRKLFLGFMQVHILYHANKEPIYGVYMLEELKRHGYDISPGTLYPLLHGLESGGLLTKKELLTDGKVRKYYSITPAGVEVFKEASKKAAELVKEIQEG